MSKYPEWVEASTATLCVRAGRQGAHRENREVLPGTDLCGPCHARFPRILTDLVKCWGDLRKATIRVQRRGDQTGPVQTSTVTDVGSLWNPAAQDVRTDIADWADYLTRTLRREHPTGTSAMPANVQPDTALAAIAKWHARWLSHYPGLGAEWLDDAVRLRARAMAAIDQPGFRRIEIPDMTCQEVLEETDYGPVRCLAPMVALLRPGDTERPSAIVCSAHPRHPRIPVEEWILAGG